MKHATKEKEMNWDAVHKSLEETIDFSKSTVDNEVVDKFIAKIIPQGNNRFLWFVNLSSLRSEEIEMVVEGRRNHSTVFIYDEEKGEESEEDDSSVHSNILYISDIASELEAKKYSPEGAQHRQLSLRSSTPSIEV